MAFRDGPFENLKVPLAWTAAVVVVVALIGAVILMLADRRETLRQDGYGPTRGGFDAAVGPVSGVTAAPVRWTGSITEYIGGYFFAVSENRRLRQKNAELLAWRDEAIALKSVNSRYEAILGLRTDPPIPMTAGRAISEARGPFARTMLLDTGTARGVRIGNPVMNDHGLVGRIVGASGGVSRMLMLTDVASRTPILIERTDARALLTGDASGNPRLMFVRGATAVQEGDRILTSGDGGGFPRGVPVGLVAKGLDGTWRVKLFSDRGPIDYVRVLLFQNFAQLSDTNALNAPPLAGLATAPAPDAAQAAAIADVAARRATAETAQADRVRAANAAPVPAPIAAGSATPPAVRATPPPTVRPTPQPQPQPRGAIPAPTETPTADSATSALNAAPTTTQPRIEGMGDDT